MKVLFLFSVLFIINACSGDNEVKTTPGDGFTTDTSNSGTLYSQENDPSFFGFDSSLLNKEEVMEKRKLLYMSIDSTYYAIHEIEKIKNEMSSQSAVGYSVAERNLKSKALFNLNLIENTLTRQLDSSLLLNLKLHTSQLQQINDKMSTDAEHLQYLSHKLEKITMIMSRITGVLGLCVSKGIIKPPTPKSKSPEIVKAGVAN